MIKGKTRKSKAYSKKYVGVCIKSLQSPIVLLQRLNIEINSPKPEEEVKIDKLNNSVKFDEEGTLPAEEQQSKKSVLRNSSVIVSSDSALGDDVRELKNEEQVSAQPTNLNDTTTAPQSALPDLDSGISLLKTKSYKFKKKFKRSHKIQPSMVTDEKLSEKIIEDPKVFTGITSTQETKVSIAVCANEKLAEETKTDDSPDGTIDNESKQHDLETISVQEKISNEMTNEPFLETSKLLNNATAMEKPTQVSTRSRSLRNTNVDDCSKLDVESINSVPLIHEKELDNSKNSNKSHGKDSSLRSTISTRTKTSKSANASPAKINNESSGIEKIEKSLPANESSDIIENKGAENVVKTRSKLKERATVNNSESFIMNSTPDQMVTQSSLNEKVIEPEIKENSMSTEDNNTIKKTILTRSKLSNQKKTDVHDELSTSQSEQSDLKIDLSVLKKNSKSSSVGKTLDTSKLATNKTHEKETPVKCRISTRSKPQERVKTNNDLSSETKTSIIGTQNADLISTSSKSNSSLSQEDNSTSSTTAIQLDNDTTSNENTLDATASSNSKAEEKISEVKRRSTRNKPLNEKNTIYLDKNITEKTLPSSDSNDTLKSVVENCVTHENSEPKNIPTRRSLQGIKSDDNKNVITGKSSIDVIVQSEQNPSVSCSIEDQREKLIDSPEHSDLNITPKKLELTSIVCTRSKMGKKETDNLEKSVAQNETLTLEQNHSIPESLSVQASEQLIPNHIVQDSLKLSTDLSQTKESTSTKSQSLEKKKEAGREKGEETTSTDLTKTVENVNTENTISTRSKINNQGSNALHKESEKILGSSKRLTQSTKSPMKIDLKTMISTEDKLLEKNGTEEPREPVVENGAALMEQNHSTLSSTLDASNLQLFPNAATADIADSSNTISTRGASTRRARANVEPRERNKRSQAKKEFSVHKQIADDSLQTASKDCNTNIQQRVCCEKEIVIKLSRCDQVQLGDNRSAEKLIPKPKSFRGKRKAEPEPTVKETSEAKKSKQGNSNDNDTDLPATSGDQPVTVDSEAQKSISENIGKLIVESPNNTESDICDTNIHNISENRDDTEQDSHQDNVSDINTVENVDCVTDTPPILEEENQCDNKLMENEKEIIVNSPDDNVSVHEVLEESLEDRDEGISVDTSENEMNTEMLVNSSNIIIDEVISTATINNQESHSLLARKMVEEVINDWAVADDEDKTSDTDSNAVNQDVSIPEVIQIDDNDDENMVLDSPQEAVSTEKEKDVRPLASPNFVAVSCENAEISILEESETPPILKEKSASLCDKNTVDGKRHSNMGKEIRGFNSTSEQTSEISEFEDIDDSNFESLDDNSCTEIFIDDNCNNHENVSQETITYYNSEDISMDVGVSENRMNDVVMNLKDACDKIAADLNSVNTSYENNQDVANLCVPELLCISDDSDDDQEEEEEEEDVVIIEPPCQVLQPQPSLVGHQHFLVSNQLRNVMHHQGSPSISVIKASELLQPPVEYPSTPTEQHAMFPKNQARSTTLFPSKIIPNNPTIFTENTVLQCPKCRCEFVGKSRLRRHWLTCGDTMYLFCPFCPNKVKQRRSLLNHINTQHPDQITPDEAVKMVDQIVRQTRDAAGIQIKPGCQVAVRDFISSTSNGAMIELPAFIRIQCVMCNKEYDEVPPTYKKTCENCSSDLMTAICQLCRKQYMLSPKMALHVQGNCIFSGRIKCGQCDFVSSGKYHLQEHIIQKHVHIEPEDYIMCTLGCGKTFRVRKALRKHELICGKVADLDCRFCEYKTKHRSAMRMHMQQHIVHQKLTIDASGSVNIFEQQSLNKRSNNVRDLMTEQEVRSVIRVHCTRCKLTLRLTSNRSSCEYCKLSYTFTCSRCPNTNRVDSLHAVRLHVIRSHCVKIHECPHCPAKYSYVYDLTLHTAKCADKKISCEFCTYVTNKQGKLRSHKYRVHHIDNEKFDCKKCGKLFSFLSTLKKHLKANCGDLPTFSCDHCKFVTKSKFSLLRHIQTQHSYIYEHFNFVCDRCNKFYTNMFSYEEHVKNCHALVNN